MTPVSLRCSNLFRAAGDGVQVETDDNALIKSYCLVTVVVIFVTDLALDANENTCSLHTHKKKSMSPRPHSDRACLQYDDDLGLSQTTISAREFILTSNLF